MLNLSLQEALYVLLATLKHSIERGNGLFGRSKNRTKHQSHLPFPETTLRLLRPTGTTQLQDDLHLDMDDDISEMFLLQPHWLTQR